MKTVCIHGYNKQLTQAEQTKEVWARHFITISEEGADGEVRM